MSRKAPLLILHGSDGEAAASRGGYRVGGYSDVYKLLAPGLPVAQANLSRQFAGTRPLPDPARFERVLNLVTDPDQHPRTLERVAKLLRGFAGRVINRPEAVMRTTRDLVARRLAGIDGLQVPRVLRLRNPRPGAASAAVERAGLSFPLIVRLAGTHTGRIIGIVNGPAELDAAAAGAGEFIITEFVDYRSPDGLHRKYRLWSFGQRAIFRHLLISDNWNVHVRERLRFMVERPDLIAEEQRALRRSEGDLPEPVHGVFAEVRGRLGLDFFGMDFGIGRDGRVILFEANATMSFFPLVTHPRFQYLDGILAPAQDAFRSMLLSGE